MPIADMPQSNKQHAVPQNIMDVEFKLIGDLTMRQFAYLLMAGIGAYLSYIIFIGLFRFPLVFLIAASGLGFAFLPVQERGLDEWVVNFFKAIFLPTERIWKKQPQLPSAFMYDNISVVKQELITLAPTSSRRKLEEYLKYQTDDENVDPLDIPEKLYAMKVRAAFGDIVPQAPATTTTVVEEPEVPQFFDQPSVTPVPPEESQSKPQEQKQAEETKPAFDAEQKPQQAQVPVAVSQPVTQALEQPKPSSPETPSTNQTPVVKRPVTQAPRPKEAPPKRPTYMRDEPTQITLSSSISVSPMTPDMHSGRRFVNLLPQQGELILPIRGERVLQTSEQMDIEEDMTEKAGRLQDLLKRIKEQEGIEVKKPVHIAEPPKPETKTAAVEKEIHAEAAGVAEALQKQDTEISDQIKKLRENLNVSKGDNSASLSQERLLKDLEGKKKSVEESYRQLSTGIDILQKPIASVTGGSSPGKAPVYEAAGFSSTAAPNTISGVVKDKEGKGIPNTLLIVKNDYAEPVRAIKTDIIGRFILSTPLQNGKYEIEVSSIGDLQLSFDKITVELKGESVPPLSIEGK